MTLPDSERMPTLCAALTYRDAATAINWLVSAFGFIQRMAVSSDDGNIAHAELSYGHNVIMVGSSKSEQGWLSPRDLPGVNQTLYLTVDDLDQHYERAKAGGAEIVKPPYDTEYGSREYSCRDLEGHYWSFGTYRPGSFW